MSRLPAVVGRMTCAHCHKPFKPRTSRQRFCRRLCKNHAYHARRMAADPAYRARQLEWSRLYWVRERARRRTLREIGAA